MTGIALVVISDGRDRYTQECAATLWQLKGNLSYMRAVDDSGGDSVMEWSSPWELVRHERRRGLAAAVRSAWADMPAGIDYVFHLESDFLLLEPVDLQAMIDVLEQHPRLAQLVLKRQPWSPEEVAAGGIIECHPDEYIDRTGWVEHRRCFSLNPCLIPRAITDLGWPPDNEAGQTQMLVDEGWMFGFWGARYDPPRVCHIGVQRANGWAL